MSREPLKIPPDDIGEWHQVPVPAINYYYNKSLMESKQARDKEIMAWLREKTSGPYYVKSHIAMVGHQPVDVYCFKESADAMMFAMLWS